MSDWLSTVAGGLLVAFVLRDVFHMIFHPGGRGGASMRVFKLVWTAAARGGARLRMLAGPAAVVLVIALWAAGLILGFALIYWPALPMTSSSPTRSAAASATGSSPRCTCHG